MEEDEDERMQFFTDLTALLECFRIAKYNENN